MNKFRKVPTPGPKFVSVTIWKQGEETVAEASGPTITGSGGISTDVWIGPPMPVPYTLDRAIDLSEKHKRQIVVIDSEELWQPEWGELV